MYYQKRADIKILDMKRIILCCILLCCTLKMSFCKLIVITYVYDERIFVILQDRYILISIRKVKVYI